MLVQFFATFRWKDWYQAWPILHFLGSINPPNVVIKHLWQRHVMKTGFSIFVDKWKNAKYLFLHYKVWNPSEFICLFVCLFVCFFIYFAWLRKFQAVFRSWHVFCTVQEWHCLFIEYITIGEWWPVAQSTFVCGDKSLCNLGLFFFFHC